MLHDADNLLTALTYQGYTLCITSCLLVRSVQLTLKWVELYRSWKDNVLFIMANWFVSTDVDQFLGSAKSTFTSLLERYTAAEITEKLGSSILATVFRQLVQHSFLLNLNFPFVLFVKFDFNVLGFFLVFLAGYFTPGAVLSGHPSQLAAEELLLFGGAAKEPFHRYWGHLFQGLSTQTVELARINTASYPSVWTGLWGGLWGMAALQ